MIYVDAKKGQQSVCTTALALPALPRRLVHTGWAAHGLAARRAAALAPLRAMDKVGQTGSAGQWTAHRPTDPSTARLQRRTNARLSGLTGGQDGPGTGGRRRGGGARWSELA